MEMRQLMSLKRKRIMECYNVQFVRSGADKNILLYNQLHLLLLSSWK